jgi:hypothetical protein
MNCEKEFSTEHGNKVVLASDQSHVRITLEKRGEELTVFCDKDTVTFNSTWLNFSISWQIISIYVDQFRRCQTYDQNYGFYNNESENITLCHKELRLYMPFAKGMDLIDILSSTKAQFQMKHGIK